MSIGETLAVIGFAASIIGFLFKNYMVLQNLNDTVKNLNKLIDKISEKQELNEDRILKLEEQTKTLFFNQKESSERIRELERK